MAVRGDNSPSAILCSPVSRAPCKRHPVLRTAPAEPVCVTGAYQAATAGGGVPDRLCSVRCAVLAAGARERAAAVASSRPRRRCRSVVRGLRLAISGRRLRMLTVDL